MVKQDIRQFVYERAHGCCEYCCTCEANTGQTMQIDHIDPAGGDDIDNLCLACWNCNNAKRDYTTFQDPITQADTPLYNPRVDQWTTHFAWRAQATIIEGLSASERATVHLLNMNRPTLVNARERWRKAGFHPRI